MEATTKKMQEAGVDITTDREFIVKREITVAGRNRIFVNNLIAVSPNPASSQIILTISNEQAADIKIDIFNLQGTKIATVFNQRIPDGKKIITRELEALPAGIYTISASRKDAQNGIESFQTLKLVKQ